MAKLCVMPFMNEISSNSAEFEDSVLSTDDVCKKLDFSKCKDSSSLQLGQKRKRYSTKLISFGLSESNNTDSSSNKEQVKKPTKNSEESMKSPNFDCNLSSSSTRKARRLSVATWKRNNPEFEEMINISISNSLPRPNVKSENPTFAKIVDAHSKLLENHIKLVNHIIEKDTNHAQNSIKGSPRSSMIQKIHTLLSTRSDQELENIYNLIKSQEMIH